MSAATGVLRRLGARWLTLAGRGVARGSSQVTLAGRGVARASSPVTLAGRGAARTAALHEALRPRRPRGLGGVWLVRVRVPGVVSNHPTS